MKEGVDEFAPSAFTSPKQLLTHVTQLVMYPPLNTMNRHDVLQVLNYIVNYRVRGDIYIRQTYFQCFSNVFHCNVATLPC